MLKRLASLLLTATLLSALFCLPAQASEYDAERPETLGAADLDADAAILIEMSSGMVVFEKNADARMYPASTTKILTVYLGVLLGDMRQTVTASASALRVTDDSSRIPLALGEQINFQDLLYATMVKSGNEGANLIAETVAGSADAFVSLMNQYAESLGCENTHFVNPSGLHSDAHYTTARDMAAIAREAMQDGTFRSIASTVTYVLPKDNKYGERTLTSRMRAFIGNPDAANYYPYAVGIKTGHTAKAGFCFVGAAEKDGVRFISVVFRCPSYASCWRDTKKLMEYGFSQYVSVPVRELYAMRPTVLEIAGCDPDDPEHGLLTLELAMPDNSRDDTLVVPGAALDGLAERFSGMISVEYARDPVAPVEAGEVIAVLTYYPEAGEPLEYPLIAARSVRQRAPKFPSLGEIVAVSLRDTNPLPRFLAEISVLLAKAVASLFLLAQ